MKSSVFLKPKKYMYIISAILVFFLLCSFSYEVNTLDEVREVLKKYYVEDLPDSTLNKQSVNEIIEEINKTDRFTKYYTKEQLQIINQNLDEIGIGVNSVKDINGLRIESVAKNSPAADKGIKVGDIIISANKIPLALVSTDAAIKLLNGDEGTIVELKVLRQNQYIELSITHKLFTLVPVEAKVISGHIGMITVSVFSRDSAAEFGEKLKILLADKDIDSLILDLRNNSGGYLNEALDISGYFIGNNTAIITKGRAEGVIKQPGVLHNIIINKKTILLVNQFSASASEIIAAVVKDYKKAFIIGENTYGMGSVQWPCNLSNGDIISLTVDKFYTAGDECIQDNGISPDYKIEDNIDSEKVAGLFFSNPQSLEDIKGCIKLNVNNYGNIIINPIQAVSADNWREYNFMLKLASEQNTIMIGTSKGWKQIKITNNVDLAKLFFPGYTSSQEIIKNNAKQEININFSEKILKSTINNKTIRLINQITGEIIPVSIKVLNEKTVKIMPLNTLKQGETYYLVADKSINTISKKAINNGMVKVLVISK